MAWIASLLPLASAHAGFETILGHVDGITQESNGATVVRGWACWTNAPGASPRVDLYVGGARDQGGVMIGNFPSDQPSDPSIDQACGTQNAPHRFVITLTIATQQQHPGKAIFVYGVPAPTLTNYTLLDGSGQFTVPAAPAVTDSVYYVHTDRLGSNVIMTDANANVVAKTDYKAYGQAELQGSKQEAPGYTGGYEDPLTGLTYMQARYYDADLGRFISTDPMPASAGDLYDFNRYAYANNNPLSFTDSTGMAAQACSATLGPDGSWDVKGCGGSGSGGGAIPPFFGWDNGPLPPRGGSGGIPSGGGASHGGAAIEPVVTVTADRPPDTIPITLPPMVVTASYWLDGVKDYFDLKFNASIGLSASGQFLPVYSEVEAGFALDSHINPCAYISVARGAGPGLPLWGAAGAVGGVGTGLLSKGKQISYGGYWAGGTGVFGEGQITHTPGSGTGFARGILGVSGSPEGVAGGFGGIKVTTTYWCLQ